MNTEHVILTQHYPSPCGDLILGSYEDRLCLCNWVIEKHQGRADNVRYSHTIYWYGFPEKSMAQIIGNPLWTNSFLW